LLGSEFILKPANGGPQVVQLDSDRVVNAVLGDFQCVVGTNGQDPKGFCQSGRIVLTARPREAAIWAIRVWR
jgi:hypothetical protein